MKRLLTVFQKVEFLALSPAELYGSFVRLRVRSRVICVGFGSLIMCRMRRSRLFGLSTSLAWTPISQVGRGFAWPAVLRRGCTPARQTEVNRGDLPRSHWPDQNLTLLLLTRYTSVFCGSCSLLCSLSILSRAGGCRPAPIGAARSDPGKPL